MPHIVNIFTAFLRRPFVAALLLQQFIFLNIILPGHTRGAITLDGKHTKDPVPCCCCCCGAGAGEAASRTKTDSKDSPSQRDKEHCALCNFAARVLPTPVVSFTLPELGLLKTVSLPRPFVPAAADLIHTYLSRGPPVGV